MGKRLFPVADKAASCERAEGFGEGCEHSMHGSVGQALPFRGDRGGPPVALVTSHWVSWKRMSSQTEKVATVVLERVRNANVPLERPLIAVSADPLDLHIALAAQMGLGDESRPKAMWGIPFFRQACCLEALPHAP